MGRRSNNKQPPPVPLESKTSPKKLGKRKADEDDARSALLRPPKKIKDVSEKAKTSSTEKRKTMVSGSESEDGSAWEGVAQGDLTR